MYHGVLRKQYGLRVWRQKYENLTASYKAQRQRTKILKLNNKSSSLNKENHDRLRFYFVFSLVLVSIEKIFPTLQAVFDHISKHLEVRKNTPFVFSVFGNVVNHGLSCLIFYLKRLVLFLVGGS